MNEDDFSGHRNRVLEEAFDTNKVPTTMPMGPQQVTLDLAPRGAVAVAVKRDEATIFRKLKVIAQAAGDDFFYRWPVKIRDKQPDGSWVERIDYIEGPSVKCTNAVARLYGNCFVSARAEDNGDAWMLNARFYDLETGYGLERPFQQRKGQNVGERMDRGRALDIVFQIGVSKATRNVVNNALDTFVDYAFIEAKEAIVQKIGKEPEKYRSRILARLRELNVGVDRVERRLGRTNDKWLVPDMAMVIAEIQAINDNMAHEDEMWPREAITAPAAPEPRRQDYMTEQKTDEKPAAQKRESIAASTVESGSQRVEHGKVSRGAAEQRDGGKDRKSEATPENASGSAHPEAKGSPPAKQVKAADPVQERVPTREEPVHEEERAQETYSAVEDDGDQDGPSQAFSDAELMLTRAAQAIKDGEIDDLKDFKRRIRINIDSAESLTDDERDILRGRFSTIVLTEEKRRADKGGKRR